MFRTQDNVPEYYVNTSRDFQLLCRLKDAAFGGVKYTIDSLCHSCNTMEMNNILLPLLKSKVGFFSKETLSEDQLRVLLAAFPAIVRYKGSKKSIESAINAWFKLNQMEGTLIDIDIDQIDHLIRLYIDSETIDTSLLDEVFHYILPTAYFIEYIFASSVQKTDEYIITQTLDESDVLPWENARIRIRDDTFAEPETSTIFNENLFGNIGTTYIPTSADLTKMRNLTNNPDGEE